MNAVTEAITLSSETRQAIDQWLERYPKDQKRSGVLQALMIVQAENGGWLNEALMDAVADYLELPRIAVYEVASFYSLYHLKPVGKHVIDVCTNISCMLRDSEAIVNHFKKRLNISPGETTADGQFTLREVECLAACAGAPMCQIGKKYYENLTPDKIDKILDELNSLDAANKSRHDGGEGGNDRTSVPRHDSSASVPPHASNASVPPHSSNASVPPHASNASVPPHSSNASVPQLDSTAVVPRLDRGIQGVEGNNDRGHENDQ